jgi:hypothetical protein
LQPREALLKYADKAENDPIYTKGTSSQLAVTQVLTPSAYSLEGESTEAGIQQLGRDVREERRIEAVIAVVEWDGTYVCDAGVGM